MSFFLLMNCLLFIGTVKNALEVAEDVSAFFSHKGFRYLQEVRSTTTLCLLHADHLVPHLLKLLLGLDFGRNHVLELILELSQHSFTISLWMPKQLIKWV
jgi:hypothetical protein